MRITSHTTPDGLALKLEGWITDAWVHELDAAWRAALDSAPGGRVCVDLREVFFVDEEGRDLLTRMYRAGTSFATRGCVMPEVMREIALQAQPVGRT